MPWIYAFRLLKASFYMEMGNASDASAFENLRALSSLASSRGDNALTVYASLLEGLALLRTARQDNIQKVRECVAQAAKFQLDPSVHIDQLDMLTMLLDVASTLNSEPLNTASQRLRQLQKRLDECTEWTHTKSEFLIPVSKDATSARTISKETAAVVKPGEVGDEVDYLVMSFLTKIEMNSLV